MSSEYQPPSDEQLADHESSHAVIAELSDIEAVRVMVNLKQAYGQFWWRARAHGTTLGHVAMAVAGSCSDGMHRHVREPNAPVRANTMDKTDHDMAGRFALALWGEEDDRNEKRIVVVQSHVVQLLQEREFRQAVASISVQLLRVAGERGRGADAYLDGEAVTAALGASPLSVMRGRMIETLERAQREFTH